MEGLEILIPLAGIFFGGMIVLVPIAGLTARLAIKPILAAVTQLRGTHTADQRTAYLEQRIALLEEQFHALERDNQRLLDESEFRKKLDAPSFQPTAHRD